MILKKEYLFNKFNLPESDHIFKFYGDNIQESVHIIDWLYQYNKDKMRFISIEYISLSEYVYIYDIGGEKYYFIALAYYHNGAIPYEVRKCITVLDKPDVVVYSVKENKVIMGFETTETGFQGNATWQRTGRVINFAERKYPFAYLAFYSKTDQSQENIREPGYLFVLMFNLLSLEYATHTMVGFSEHPDKSHWLDKKAPQKDMKPPIFNYLYSLIIGKSDLECLENAYYNMKEYYFSDPKLEKTVSEFGSNNLSYMREEGFEKNILENINSEQNIPFFHADKLVFEFNPTKINKEKFKQFFPDIKFMAISKNSTAGITFETAELVSFLNDKTKMYIEDLIENKIEEPTIIIPTKMTKKQNGKLIFTDDPYNGEIIAFANMYRQSFPEANIILLLCDHTNSNEYDVEDAKGRKIYKAIDKYADILIDLDYNVFSNESEKFRVEKRDRYEKIFTTEDDVTSFFGTILHSENIEVSFLNPPSGSWSDIKLLPSNGYYYLQRNEKRGDIAYFDREESIYYVGESKKDYSSLKNSLQDEYFKTKNLSEIIVNKLQNKYPYKTFAIFKGDEDEADKILKDSKFDMVIIVDDSENISLKVFER